VNERGARVCGLHVEHDLLGIRNETFLGAPRPSEYIGYVYIIMSCSYVIFYPYGLRPSRYNIVNPGFPIHIYDVYGIPIHIL